MAETVEGEIDRLAALQDFDRRLKDKQDHMTSLLAEAEDFETQLAALRATAATLAAEHEALEAQRAEMDARLDTEGTKIRDSRMRLNRVRNDREMLALQREIDLGKEANQQLEEQLIAVMEGLEELGKRLAEGREAVQAMEDQTATEVDSRRAEAETLSREVADGRSQRDALAEGMDPALRSKYEQIFERRGGTAVVEVRQGTCMGCHMNVPPQLFNELQRYRSIRQCPSCHRILYWRSETAADASAQEDTGRADV